MSTAADALAPVLPIAMIGAIGWLLFAWLPARARRHPGRRAADNTAYAGGGGSDGGGYGSGCHGGGGSSGGGGCDGGGAGAVTADPVTAMAMILPQARHA